MNDMGEHRCPVCGKLFYVPDFSEWAYRMSVNGHLKLFCSWTCYRKQEKERDEKRLQSKRDKWQVKSDAEREQ